MKVFIVYCHPSEDSLTCHIRDSFIEGLLSRGHSYILSDLYRMNFKADMSEAEYLREAYYRKDLPVPGDVLAEQEKINASDAIAFIYPVFWSEAPAKLVGWFDRVWTFGFAYGDGRTMKQLEKALVLVSAGNTNEYFERTGILEAMKKVILEDRLFDRVKQKEIIIFDAASREKNDRNLNMEKHLKRAFDTGAALGEQQSLSL
ncbi:MAG: NAD(P)H-dependent oxidoreductase [Treponema sp.]|nr:NAD(P)H-dependent oxidoreductase [Treponema sp.]